MFDIGFLELLVLGVVLLLVMGPERLPDVAKQIAFFIRKARQGVYRLRTEMQDEIQGTPFADLEAAKREIADLKNDIKQFGRDLADSADEVKSGIQEQVDDVKNLVDPDSSDEFTGAQSDKSIAGPESGASKTTSADSLENSGPKVAKKVAKKKTKKKRSKKKASPNKTLSDDSPT